MYYNFKILSLLVAISLVLFLDAPILIAQKITNEKRDSVKQELLQDAQVTSQQKQVKITIQNVDITSFPVVKIIVEAFNVNGEPLDTLPPETINVVENGVDRKVVSVEKISIKERVPVDFIFVIDKTGSMQNYIDQTKKNIYRFTNSLQSRGIDYKIGLVLFSDYIERVFQPTSDLSKFLSWLDGTHAEGGGDFKENALEALTTVAGMEFRPSANKVAVIITDAPYHQQGEGGEGRTDYTTSTIIKYLNKNEIRVFSIVPPKQENYATISKSTRGTAFDIDFPFSTILDKFSHQLTNLFAIRYRTGERAIPDSIQIALLNQKRQELVRKIIPIIELGRKLIIENLLYETNSCTLASAVPELEVLTEFLKNKTNVVILVEGHTDNVGSNKTNDALSLQRAESVKAYLVKQGIAAHRIKTKGYGKRRPIGDNGTEWGRKLNRRTEIVIVSK